MIKLLLVILLSILLYSHANQQRNLKLKDKSSFNYNYDNIGNNGPINRRNVRNVYGSRISNSNGGGNKDKLYDDGSGGGRGDGVGDGGSRTGQRMLKIQSKIVQLVRDESDDDINGNVGDDDETETGVNDDDQQQQQQMNNHEIDHHQTQIEQPKIFEQKSRQLRPLPKRQPQQQQQQQQQQKYQSKPTYKTEEQFIYRPAHYFSDDPNDPNRNRHRLNNNNNKSPKYVIEKHGKSRSNKPIQMINDVNEDEDDSLPAMFPQLANVINQYNSEQSDQSMGGRQQLDTNHVRSKSNQPRFTATTTRSAPTPPKMMMENPRIYTKPMYDQRVMPTRPQLNYRPINQYETNIESPPKSTEPYSFDGSPSRSIVKDPSSDALSFYLSSIQGDSQPPPQTPSSINDEVYNLNSFSVKTSHPNRQRTSPSTSMKFDPSNSVRAGPNTFMSLRFEPSNDDENKQNNNSPSNKFYTSQQRSQPQLDPNRITYRTQTVNSIEDQQQRPTRNHYESRHVMSPNKYNPAPLASVNFRQRKAVKNEDAKPETGRAQVYSYFHTFPTNNDESKVKTKQTKTQLKKVDVKPQDSKYQNKYRQPQAKNRQNYKSKPKNDRINQYNGNQASASEMMSNTVKPNKFNWKLNVQRYAKEFGFQLPPSLAEQNFELQSANEEPILSSPLEIEQKQSRNQIPMASNPSYQATNLNNDSSMVRYYYDIVQPSSKSTSLDQSINLTESQIDQSVINGKHEQEQQQEIKSEKDDKRTITQEEVDEIMQRYNEVINAKKNRATSATNNGDNDDDLSGKQKTKPETLSEMEPSSTTISTMTTTTTTTMTPTID